MATANAGQGKAGGSIHTPKNVGEISGGGTLHGRSITEGTQVNGNGNNPPYPEVKLPKLGVQNDQEF